jgi:hypothetical protein
MFPSLRYMRDSEAKGPDGTTLKDRMSNDANLQQLLAKSGEDVASFDPTNSGMGDLQVVKRVLKKELAEDVDEAFKKNLELFKRTLDFQSEQLTGTITSTAEHIISSLSRGVHKKLSDTVRDPTIICPESGLSQHRNCKGFGRSRAGTSISKGDGSSLS